MLPSPYGPDRSLLLASILLIGGVLLTTGLIYLLVTIGPMLPSPTHSPEAQIAHSSPRTTSAPQREGDRTRARPLHTHRSASRNRHLHRSGTHSPPSMRFPDRLSPDLPSTTYSPETQPLFSSGIPTITDLPTERSGRLPDASILGHSSPPQNHSEWPSTLSHLNRRLQALSGALATANRARSFETRSRAESEPSTAPGPTSDSPGVPNPPPQVLIDGRLGWLTAAGATYATLRLRTQAASDEESLPHP